MPEGTSIAILKEELQPFKKNDIASLSGKEKLTYLLIRVQEFMREAFRFRETKEIVPPLNLLFNDSDVNLYHCNVKMVEDDVETLYNWKTDVTSDEWSPAHAEKALKKLPDVKVCDALLNQEIFAGVGNIVKNEVLFRIKVHPESTLGCLPPQKLRELIKEARNYSLDLYGPPKKSERKKQWLVYKKKACTTCNRPIARAYTGNTDSLTCFCPNCQVSYQQASASHKVASIDKLIF